MIPRQFAHLGPHISVLDACAAVDVSRRTMYNWMAAGKVEYVLTAGGSRRIVTESLWRAAGDPTVPSYTAQRGLNNG